MLGIILEVIVILSCPLRLQEEHKDPFILDQENYRIQESSENKSCSKWRGWQWPPWWFQTLLIIILSNVCFLNFLEFYSYLGQEWRGPYALPGVVEDRRGWQWPPGWFLTLLIIIWSNFCFLNFLVFCSYLGQEWRGPCALPGVIEDRRGWQWSLWWFLT